MWSPNILPVYHGCFFIEKKKFLVFYVRVYSIVYSAAVFWYDIRITWPKLSNLVLYTFYEALKVCNFTRILYWIYKTRNFVQSRSYQRPFHAFSEDRQRPFSCFWYSHAYIIVSLIIYSFRSSSSSRLFKEFYVITLGTQNEKCLDKICNLIVFKILTTIVF